MKANVLNVSKYFNDLLPIINSNFRISRETNYIGKEC